MRKVGFQILSISSADGIDEIPRDQHEY